MSVRRLAPKELQPASFTFSEENLAWARNEIAKYPPGRQASAAIAILWRVQEQHRGWVSEAAIRAVADLLEMPYIRMLEIATFYTMFQLEPVGKKAHVQVCGTTPCRLRGAGDIINISSLAGRNAFAGGGIYCASKWGLQGLSACMAEDLREHGIRVSVICPGSVATEFSTRSSKDPSKVLSPEDVAHAVEMIVTQGPRSFLSEIHLRPVRKP